MHKEIRNTLAWIVFATFLMFTAVWQAQVAAKRDLEARRRTLPPPPKTKRADRPALQPYTGDPVADYIVRCEKGLTDQEIGWIIEDFRNAGLTVEVTDGTSDTQLFAYRAAQQSWYHRALVDGLRLTPEQSFMAAAKLAELFQTVTASFKRDQQKGKIGPAGENTDPFGGRPSARYDMITPTWILAGIVEESPPKHGAMPWELCPLPPAQAEIIWTKAELVRSAKDPANPMPGNTAPAAEGLRKQLRNSQPFEGDDDLPYELNFSKTIFPFLRSQKFPLEQPQGTAEEMRALYLSDARHLHPAQLKILLLLYPHVAGEIQTAMDTTAR